MGRPIPAYINDPVMAGAFSAFMGWAWEQPGAHAAFCEATGAKQIPPATDPISILVDEATGAQAGYATAFIEWLIVNHWGEDGKVDETRPLDPLPPGYASVLKASRHPVECVGEVQRSETTEPPQSLSGKDVG